MRVKKITYKMKRSLSDTLIQMPAGSPRLVATEEFDSQRVRAIASYVTRTRGMHFKITTTDKGSIVLKLNPNEYETTD